MAEARALLREAAARIERLDAEVLLAHLAGVPRLALLADLGRDIDAGGFAALVARREAGEPVAYITGRREFWSLDLAVTPDVLIPRPDSETLVAAALEALPGVRAPRILDLGTGSGALLLAALSEWPGGWGAGVDASAAALGVARANAAALGLAGRVAFVRGDWAAALGGRFDLVLCNPPYVADGAATGPGVAAHEPHAALFAGADGLDAYRALMPQIARLLAPGGAACVEIGFDQAAAVTALADAAGLAAALRRDLAGRPRCLVLRARN